jgi:hypothetical protein
MTKPLGNEKTNRAEPGSLNLVVFSLKAQKLPHADNQTALGQKESHHAWKMIPLGQIKT